MHLIYDGKKYPCKCSPWEIGVYRGLPDDFPAPVVGEIVLCADDGFVLRTDKTEDYLRQIFEDGVLTLTNAAEQPEEPEEEETPSISERVEALEAEAEQAKIDRAALTYLLTGEETL